MNVAQRFLYQAVGRPFIFCRSSEILQYGVKNYNSSNFCSTPVQEYHLCNPSFNNGRISVNQYVSRTSRGSYVKVLTKNFSNGSVAYSREFIDGENTYAHNVLLSLPEYRFTTVNNDPNMAEHVSVNNSSYPVLEKDWSTSDLEEIVQAVLHITMLSGACSLIDDIKYTPLFCSICTKVNELSDDHIIQILSVLTSVPHTSQSNNLSMLTKALNESCSFRIKFWSTSRAFLIADYWYILKMEHMSAYFSRLTTVLANRISTMSPSELVQYMFCANLYRNLGPVKRNNLERQILDALDRISIEEVGIIAMGFFKTDTSIINEKLKAAFIKKTIDNLGVISSPALSAILKLLRKSLTTTAVSQCKELLEELNHHLNRFETLALIHVALLGTNLLVFNENVINFIAQRFGSEMSELRLKDIQRFTYTLMLFRYTPTLCPTIFDLIINELRKPERVVEINHFPTTFISCINYITEFGIFPFDLISASLQPSMIELLKHSRVHNSYSRELNELNWTIQIEVPPSYPGYRLTPDLSRDLTKKFIGRIPKENNEDLTHQEHFTLDVKKKLSDVIGHSIFPILILPHFTNPDLVFCTNSDGEPVPVPEEYLQIPHELLKVPLNYSNLIWNAIIIGGRNSFIRYSYKLRGNFEMKRRQLKLLGYNVSVIPHQDYVKKTVKKKMDCLENALLNSSLKMKTNSSQIESSAPSC